MTENLNAQTETAAAVVTMVKGQISRETKVYAAYVEAHGVTADTIAEHVTALRERAYPGIKADGRAALDTPERKAKRFADKVRIGLRTAVGDSPADRAAADTDYLAKVLKAADAARDNGTDADAVLAAITAWAEQNLG